MAPQTHQFAWLKDRLENSYPSIRPRPMDPGHERNTSMAGKCFVHDQEYGEEGCLACVAMLAIPFDCEHPRDVKGVCQACLHKRKREAWEHTMARRGSVTEGKDTAPESNHPYCLSCNKIIREVTIATSQGDQPSWIEVTCHGGKIRQNFHRDDPVPLRFFAPMSATSSTVEQSSRQARETTLATLIQLVPPGLDSVGWRSAVLAATEGRAIITTLDRWLVAIVALCLSGQPVNRALDPCVHDAVNAYRRALMPVAKVAPTILHRPQGLPVDVEW